MLTVIYGLAVAKNNSNCQETFSGQTGKNTHLQTEMKAIIFMECKKDLSC